MFYLITSINAFLSLLLAAVTFFVIQTKAFDLLEMSELREKAKQIRVGEVYESRWPATPLEPEKIYQYEITRVKDGYVESIYTHTPGSSPVVERGTDFLKYKTKVK